jgi:hypothetical protein
LLVFDFTESTKGRTYDTKSTRGEDWAISARATADAAGRTLTREIDTFRKIGRHARRSHEIHRARVYRRNEMLGLLRRAGFRVVMRRSLGSVRLIRSDLIAIAERRARR